MNFYQSACKEPYRLLFPLGTLLIFFGLGGWVVYWLFPSWGYPLNSHITLQTGPLMLSFMLGFLYTALPRVFRIPSLSKRELTLLLMALLGQCVGTFARFPLLVECLYLFTLLQFTRYWGRHQSQFKAPIPPPFRFITLAFSVNILATSYLLLVLGGLSPFSPFFTAARMFQIQGFLLCILLGAGLFLIPGLTFRAEHTQDYLRTHNRFSRFNSLQYTVLSFLLVLTYIIEPLWPVEFLSLRVGTALRLFVILYLLFARFKLHRLPRKQPPILIWTYVSLWCLPLAPVGTLIWPRERISFDHIIYINGFILLAFTIAAKILSGHAGKSRILKKHPRWMWWFGGLITLGMSTRVTAFFVKSYNMHLGVAALCVLIAVVIWACIYLPRFREFPNRSGPP